MAATPRLRFREAPLRHLLSERGGAVSNYTSRRAEKVATRARGLVHVRTGKLRRSIKTVYRGDLKEAAVEVRMGGPGVDYAMAYHEGHKAFTLPAKSADDSPSVYVFNPHSLTMGQSTVFTRGPIRIPRTEGHPVLDIAARMEGFRVRIRRSF